MSIQIQNLFKQTITLDWSIGTGIFYIKTKPIITNGWLVVSPNNATIREIIAYTSTGTDTNGDYIVVSQRGVGGTIEQTHTVGEPIRMNVTAEYWKYMGDAIDAIVAAGAPNADTTTKGLVEMATDAEVTAGTNFGGTGASLVATPGQIIVEVNSLISIGKIVPIVRVLTSSGTWTKPVGLKYIEVEMVGSGGNGGAGSGSYGGGGGGGGGYGKKLYSFIQLSDTISYTVGSPSTFINIITGTLTANGGGNGGTGPAATGGVGGTALGFDININGSKGWFRLSNSAGSNSGTSPLSGGITFGGYPDFNGTGYGSGGGGANSTDGAGGIGSPGIIIIKEFY